MKKTEHGPETKIWEQRVKKGTDGERDPDGQTQEKKVKKILESEREERS